MRKLHKKAQEEMVGFALIIIIVAIILLIFLGFSLRSPQKQNVESYEAESFIQSLLQYTTECENNVEKLPVQKLVFSCMNKEQCLDGRGSCEVLDDELGKIMAESWRINPNSPVKGYDLEIYTNKNETISSLKKGNETQNSKGGGPQSFARGGDTLVEITIQVYY